MVREIYNKLLNKEALVIGKSLYASNGKCLVRVADHLPEDHNIDHYDEDEETIILILCGGKVGEREADDCAERIAAHGLGRCCTQQ